MKNCKGLKCTLLRSGDDWFIRVGSGTNFKDYLIKHNNLEIIIDDLDSQLRSTPNGEYDGMLDHTDETLGIK